MTYGRIFDDLKKLFKLAKQSTYQNYFGQKNYYNELVFSIHVAFDNYCESLNIDPKLRGEFRKKLKDGSDSHLYLRSSSSFDLFFNFLPNEFNVRGQWTSLSINIQF